MSDEEDLRREVRRLRDELEALRRRVDSFESTRGDDTVRDRHVQPAESETAFENESEVSTEGLRDNDQKSLEATGESIDAERDWELAVGVRWLGLAGALALVVGVVFFVRLAIEMGLLGPFGRIAAGTVGGVLLLAIGRYVAVRQRYVRWGRIAAGTGLAVAYFSLYAAYGFESYREAIGTPLIAVLVGMTALIAVTATISIRDGSPLVVGESFVLGYATAYLSTEAATLLLTPSYVLLLAVGTVTISRITSWDRLVATSPFATYGVLGLWAADVDPPSSILATVTLAVLLTYLVGAYVIRERVASGRLRDRVVRIALTASNALFATILLEVALRDAFPEAPVEGVGTLVVSIVLAGAFAATARRPGRRVDTAAATSIVLLALAIAMAVGPFWTTVGALSVIGLGVSLSGKTAVTAFRHGTHLVAAGLAVKLLAVDATELPGFDLADPVSTLTGRPVAFALAIGTFYGLAWLYVRESATLTGYERGEHLSVDGIYAAVGTGLTVISLGLEFSGLGVSVAWGLFGFVLLGIGLYIDTRGVRLLAIAVLGIATVKVFLYDTSGLDTVSRTLSFLVLGAILLAASYIYARLRDDIDIGVDLFGREGG